MQTYNVTLEQHAPLAFRFYRHALEIMQASGIPFLLGGAYAFDYYTGISRHTKDLDLFVSAAHVRAVLERFAAAGYRADLVFSHWLGKVIHGEDFIDVIFNSGNGLCPVDGDWFKHAVEGVVLGAPALLVPAEEMIWQKCYIMERERFDGADVMHLLRARGRLLDWDRLLARFGTHWRVLLSHLILYGFVYPHDRESVPDRVLEELTSRLAERPDDSQSPTRCQGPLLSRIQYLVDTEEWGCPDPRLEPLGQMTKEQVNRWTEAGL